MKEILLVEDDKIDVMTIKRAISDLGLSIVIKHVNNGQEAIDYLVNDKNPYPDLILLDINMPVMNGLEFLKERKNYEVARLIPAVVLTTSRNEADRFQCFKSCIAGYIVKPVDYKEFVKAISVIESYWALSELPEI